MKTKEELSAIKEEVEAVYKKLAELSEDELAQISGGAQKKNWEEGDQILLHLATGGTQECDEFLVISLGHGKNGKPTLPLSDEA